MITAEGVVLLSVVAGIVALGVVLGTVLSASAATPSPPVPAGRGGRELAPMMLVLDASGSMAAKASAATTRMAAAKQAVHEVLAQTPADARVGMTVYGTRTGSSAAEKARGCRDVTVAHPVRTLDRPGLRRVTDGIRPRGYTPIGYALQVAAARHLPGSGPRSIVLVSDGVDTCAPPEPCAVARRLSQQHPDLRIHTIGFQVDARARAQLVCIAQVTGGTYAAAPDAADLGAALTRTTAQALRNYQPAGSPVRGTTDPDTAPTMLSGTHVDTLGAAARQYYAVDVAAGETVHLGATAIYPRGQPGYQNLHLRMSGPDGADCQIGDDDVSSQEGDAEPLTTALTWNGTSATDRGVPCHQPGRYTFEVWRNRDGGDPVPLELFVHLEAPLADPALPPPASRPVAFTQPGGTLRSVAGGGSFGSAATLPGSGQYADKLQHGEFVFYRVAVDWGQGLAVRVHYDPGDRTVVNIKSSLYAPVRQQIGTATANYVGRASILPAPNGAFTTLPVRYRNRDSGEPAQRAQSQAGWYYVAVKLGRGTGTATDGAPIRVRLDVSVVGQPEPGPQYVTAAGSATSAGSSAEHAEPSAAARPGPGFGNMPVWALAGLATLAGSAAVLVAVRRRTRGPRGG